MLFIMTCLFLYSCKLYLWIVVFVTTRVISVSHRISVFVTEYCVRALKVELHINSDNELRNLNCNDDHTNKMVIGKSLGIKCLAVDCNSNLSNCHDILQEPETIIEMAR